MGLDIAFEASQCWTVAWSEGPMHSWYVQAWTLGSSSGN